MINIRHYVREELKKYDGIYLPVKANILEQIFVSKISPKKIHPNPNDEFCFEDIGPSDKIIGKYCSQISINRENGAVLFDDSLIVEKIRPDGYMLLNGHHRWAAGILMEVKTLPVKVTNLTQPSDIVDLLKKTSRTKRASINLDDVVFCQDNTGPAEKPLFFPFNKIFPERIRKGIPGLVYALRTAGYDVWVYTAGYSSTDYINQLFRHHRIRVDGIVNGTNRMKSAKGDSVSRIKKIIAEKYRVTLNIDLETVSWIRSEIKDFEQIDIPSNGEDFGQQVIAIVRKLKDL